MKHLHIPWRGILARLPLPMLALAASYGVYRFALLFVPEWVAIVQAAAFETTYIGLAVTRGLDPAGRKRATAISLGAVVASIIYNTLAGWFHAQPDVLASAGRIAWLCLAVLHGAPLAWVAFLVANLLLHRQDLAASTDQQEGTQALPALALAHSAEPTAEYATARLEAPVSGAELQAARVYRCKRCGHPSSGLSAAGQHARACKRAALVDV